MNIDHLLKSRKITKVTLAERLGISREYLYRMLDNPTEAFMGKLADVLEVSTQELQHIEPAYPSSVSAITFLPFERWRFVKQINIVIPYGPDRNLEAGCILYKRPFAAGYEMRKRRSDESEVDYLLTFDNPENFPHDYLDDIILEGIRRDYPASYVTNYRIVTDSDLKTLDMVQQRPRKEFTFMFCVSGPQEQLIEDTRNGVSHYYIRQQLPFYRTTFTSFSDHIVCATAFFDFNHEQEVCGRFDRKEIVFL